jgi:rubrerythrin
MNIYKYAMQMELDGEKYYRDLAANATSAGMRKIFGMLADEEIAHFDILKRISNNDDQLDQAETDVLQDAKNIFSRMQGEESNISPDADQVDLYRKAFKHEEDSYQFYLQKSEEAETEAEKRLLLKLAVEEKKHMHLIDNIIDFVSRPATWLADAEFNKLDDY